MPLYDYECNKCGAVKEKFYPMDSFPRQIYCVDCGGSARKIITGVIMQDEHPSFLADQVDAVCDVEGYEHDKQRSAPQTRSELKRYLEEEGYTERPAKRGDPGCEI